MEVTTSFLKKKLPGLFFDSVIIIGQMLQVAWCIELFNFICTIQIFNHLS